MLNYLNEYKRNVYSQNGEDGIIEEIFNRLELKIELKKFFCEFGAWDGVHLSNTHNLYKNKNFEGVLIEPDKLRYLKLCKNLPDKKIIKINSFISFEGSNSLENLLKQNQISIQFDFLSIDIDGCDYYIFESIKNIDVKIVCVEFNPTIPNEVEFIQKKNFQFKQGCSALSLNKLAQRMGYDLIAATYNNLFFSKQNLTSYIIKNKPKLSEIRNDQSIRNYVFYGYDGSIITSKLISLPWHGLDKINLNILPKFLLNYPSDYNFFQKIYFYCLKFFRSPKKYLRNLKKYLLLFLSKF